MKTENIRTFIRELRVTQWVKKRIKGQSLVEITLLFPVLLIMLSGLLEFGFLLNEYLTLQDAVRNAARFSSDSDYTATDSACSSHPFPTDPECCRSTQDFFRQTACLVNLELRNSAPDVSLLCLDSTPPGAGQLCNYAVVDPTNGDENSRDDIIISVFSIAQPDEFSTQPGLVRIPTGGNGGEGGWSYALAYSGYNTRNQNSGFTSEDIQQRLNSGAPSTGYLLVEIYYNYNQKLKLPWITAFVDDPVTLHSYAIMPLVSAEPTPSPIPPP